MDEYLDTYVPECLRLPAERAKPAFDEPQRFYAPNIVGAPRTGLSLQFARVDLVYQAAGSAKKVFAAVAKTFAGLRLHTARRSAFRRTFTPRQK